MLIALYYMLMFGSYTAFGNLQSEIFRPYGLKIYEIAILGCVSLLCGVVSCILFGKLLDRTKRYRLFMTLIPLVLAADLTVFTYYALPTI